MVEGYYDELGNPNKEMYCIVDASDYGHSNFKAY